MFSKQDEEYLIRRLARNEVVLFLGAGFSMMAENRIGEKLPTGKRFAQKIWDFLKSNGEYDNTSLPVMYQALLKSGRKFNEIEQLLEDNFLVASFPDIYQNLTIPFWFKVYTTNIDNLIEKIYNRSKQQRVQTLQYPNDEFKERDQTLDFLQAIYLHGKLKCRPDEVIFSRSQYAGSTLTHQPLYQQFVHDYSTLPTVFVGTSLDEPIFDQYIAARQARRSDVAENRPRSFLIDPYIGPVQENVYRDSYNIEPIKTTTEEFLIWLGKVSSKLPNRIETLKTVLPALNDLLLNKKFKEIYYAEVSDFSQSFQKVSLELKSTKSSKAFLLGTSPTFSDIYANLDAARNINAEIYNYIESKIEQSGELSTIAILGTAGSGKSTILKRLSYALTKNGRTVFFSHSETIPKIDSLFKTLEMLNEKVVLAFDNSELILSHLTGITEELKKLKFPPVILLATRSNIFFKLNNYTNDLPNLKEFYVPNLERDEIIRIIDVLEENNLLGSLKGLSQDQRIKEFEYRAKKQILVAMREATNGRDFDEIIKSEFEQIEPQEAKVLCLCVALTTDAGFTISRQDFVAFSSQSPSDVLDILERILRDIILKAGPKKEKILLRHRLIAAHIIESCVTKEMLKQAYIRVLASLADELKNAERNSRKFLLYREIINHSTIYRRFSKDIGQAREVYESLSKYFNDDFQFWLQYGSLEAEGIGGSLQLAENYLNQAFSLKPKNLFVRNAMANLLYKKAVITNSESEAILFKEHADKVLTEAMQDKYSNDPYTYYIYVRGFYKYALKWSVGNRRALKKCFEEIGKVIKEAIGRYPNDRKLKTFSETILKAILTTAVDGEVQYPIMYNDAGGQDM